MSTKRNAGKLFLGGVAVAFTAAVHADGASTITTKADAPWKETDIPGVSAAAVQGDMGKGASHFFLKYPAGFVTPVHHHSADHYVVTVSGNLVLVVDGKEHRLPPGSYFSLTGKAAHAARCEGAEPCVMFIDARDKWDVVPESH